MKSLSTSDVQQAKFRAHGRVEVTLCGNIARYEAWGPFNEELGMAFASIQKQVLPEMAAFDRWGELTTFHISMMAPAGLLAQFTEGLIIASRQGLTPYATAYVIGPEVEGGQLMERLIMKCYESAGLLLKIFRQPDEAEAWLQSTLAAAPPKA